MLSEVRAYTEGILCPQIKHRGSEGILGGGSGQRYGEQVFCVPQIMPGVWLVLSKATFLFAGPLQRGHGEGVPVSGTEEEVGGPCLALHPTSPSSYDASNPLLHTEVTTEGWGGGGE